MRSIVLLAIGLSFTCITSAETINLLPVPNSMVSGRLTISSSDRADVDYNLQNAKPNQNYTIVVYENGNCDSYSSPVIPMVTDSDGKVSEFEFTHKQSLAFIDANAQTSRAGGIVSSVGSHFSNIDFKGKVLVVQLADASGSPIDVAVACGIYP